MILNSKVFREELERIIEDQLREGYHPASLLALQQISELLMPNSRCNAGNVFKGTSCGIPIADIRGMDSLAYSKGEKLIRCKLASAYRLVDLHGWSEGIYNHISVRVSRDLEHFLINPYGLMYHEITASSLMKVDMQGNVLEPGSTNLGFNTAGFTLHSAIHAARPDVRCIIHVHCPVVTAVGSCKQGLLPLSQEAALIGNVSYHDYKGVLTDLQEREEIARNLGPVNKVMMLRNHGSVCCGESVEEAFWYLERLVLACETQAKMMPFGIENLVFISEETMRSTAEKLHAGMTVNSKDQEAKEGEVKERHRKPRLGELEFEAHMRMLDNAGFRTGYAYKFLVSRSEPPRQKSDVEVPPASSSYTHIFDEDDLARFSPLKRILDSRKAQDKTRWLNSPNVYQKVELLETGTNDPKKIVKWVADGSPTHNTAIKIENSHQFVPTATDAQEFRRKQKELKENRMQSKVTAGPQSHILEGVTWDEIKKLQDATMSGTGDQVVVVGAASKGIIQREFQHNATVYKTPYAKNPFDSITDEELEEYKKIVEKKQRGEPFDDDIVEEETTQVTVTTTVTAVPATVPAGALENDATVVDTWSNPQSPTSPLSEDEVPRVVEVQKVVMPVPGHAQPKIVLNDGETAVNGDDAKEGIRSAESGDNISSRSSKEGSPTKEVPGGSPKKEKKKKKGLRTPSFLKKKKDKKKKDEAEDTK